MKFGKYYLCEDKLKIIFGLEEETVIIKVEFNDNDGSIEMTTCSSNQDSNDVWGERGQGIRRKTVGIATVEVNGERFYKIDN